MEKAKLTREQARVLEGLLNEMKRAYERPEGMLIHNQVLSKVGQVTWSPSESAMEDLGVDEVCRALYVGYEIIEEDQDVVVTADMREELKKARNDVLDFRRLENTADARTWYAKGIGRALEILGVEERR